MSFRIWRIKSESAHLKKMHHKQSYLDPTQYPLPQSVDAKGVANIKAVVQPLQFSKIHYFKNLMMRQSQNGVSVSRRSKTVTIDVCAEVGA